MKKTTWISTVVVAALIAAVALIAPATASGRVSKAKHELTGTLRVKLVESGGGYPAVGGTYTFLALYDARLDGKARHGVLESRGSITGQPDATTIESKQDDRAYFPEGSLKTSSPITATLNPDGSLTSNGKATVTGGTGDFKGATGSVTATCSSPTLDPNGVIDCQLNGMISY
jgi:hypothetical protein